MMPRLTLIFLTLVVAACGVQRPLLRPANIPAHQAAQQAKREKMERERAEQAQQDAADAAGRQAIEDAQ